MNSMHSITFVNVPKEVNTVEKTIQWLQEKLKNDEKFDIITGDNEK